VDCAPACEAARSSRRALAGARYYPGGLFTLFAAEAGRNAADEDHAGTMAFTTLMMFQLVNVYN